MILQRGRGGHHDFATALGEVDMILRRRYGEVDMILRWRRGG